MGWLADRKIAMKTTLGVALAGLTPLGVNAPLREHIDFLEESLLKMGWDNSHKYSLGFGGLTLVVEAVKSIPVTDHKPSPTNDL